MPTLAGGLARPRHQDLPQDIGERMPEGRAPTAVEPSCLRLDPHAVELARGNLLPLARAMVTCGQIDAQQASAALTALAG